MGECSGLKVMMQSKKERKGNKKKPFDQLEKCGHLAKEKGICRLLFHQRKSVDNYLSVDNYIIMVRFVLIILMSLNLALLFVVVVLMFESD